MNATGPALRDIHLPDAPGFWPPAPGWWILAVLVLVFACLLWRALRPHLARRAWRRQLAAELQRVDQQHPPATHATEHVAALSVLLRRLAIRHDAANAALTGEAWLAFLDGADPARPFANGPGRLLLDGPYRPRVEPEQALALRTLVGQALAQREWVQRV